MKYYHTHFLYSASTVELRCFWVSFMEWMRSLMSLDSTWWAISTWSTSNCHFKLS